MKTLTRLLIAFLACTALVFTVVAGPEPMPSSYKESKEVVPQPPPPACDWSGVYFGLHAGGQVGHSQTTDLDEYNFEDLRWGYSEVGFNGGGQAGYNFQLGMFVTGVESDVGYMNLNGSGVEPNSPGDDTHARTDSDFYFTVRGRVGLQFDLAGCWLLYGTGGLIGVNYEKEVTDNCATGDCGFGRIHASNTDFNWGYTVGGGIERKLGRHWSTKIEYLYFSLDADEFSGDAIFKPREGARRPNGKDFGNNFRFDAETFGHILRLGLNYHF